MAESKARERVKLLLDQGSFVEQGALVRARMTDFSLKNYGESSDGVITGYGTIDGNPVYVFSQDREVLNGTVGEMHAKKIIKLYQLAEKNRLPVVGLYDSAGFRLQESVDALDAYQDMLQAQSKCNGEVLQIFGIFGGCMGGQVTSAALADFVFMTEEAQMYVNAPHTISDEKGLFLDFNSGKFQSQVAGTVDLCKDEAAVIEKIRRAVCFLARDEYGCCDEAELNRLVTADGSDPRALLAQIADNQAFLELKKDHHPEMVTGFMKLNGIRVGVVANGGDYMLTAGGCRKAALHVNFCNAAGIPLLTLVHAEGIEAVLETEKSMARNLGKLFKESAGIQTEKVNLIIGDSYGTAYMAMTAKAAGVNMTLAYSGLKVGMMEAEKAGNILFANDPEAEQKTADYEARQNSIESAAARGCVDNIIDPRETRKHLIMAYSML